MQNKIFTVIKKEETGNISGICSSFDLNFMNSKCLELNNFSKSNNRKDKFKVIETEIKYNSTSSYDSFYSYENRYGK